MPWTGLDPWHPNPLPGHLSRSRRPHPTNTGFISASQPQIKQDKESIHEHSESSAQGRLGNPPVPDQGAAYHDPSPNQFAAVTPTLRPTSGKAYRPRASDPLLRAARPGAGSSKPTPAPRTHSSIRVFHRLRGNAYSRTRCLPRLPSTTPWAGDGDGRQHELSRREARRLA